ncbi:hypothetical protein CHM34_09395 [Paludifilum halophilum]|uniref:Uncharacterized protein n=1 Tax=Paludifilum halophilum TaxID=1642702 RepID=A0A235B7X0_9BACL|nr:hypothetical protein CHM34_09395 [Paludifilum halophilum]
MQKKILLFLDKLIIFYLNCVLGMEKRPGKYPAGAFLVISLVPGKSRFDDPYPSFVDLFSFTFF